MTFGFSLPVEVTLPFKVATEELTPVTALIVIVGAVIFIAVVNEEVVAVEVPALFTALAE